MIDLTLKKYSQGALEALKENVKCYPEDGELWWSSYSDSRRFDKPIGSVGGDGYPEFNFTYEGKNYRYKVHIVLWALTYGEWHSSQLDHKDRVRHNNKIDNLRGCSYSENLANRSSRGLSKYRGVCYYKATGDWTARVMKEGVSYYLGYFKTEEDAHQAYKTKAKELYGEFYTDGE